MSILSKIFGRKSTPVVHTGSWCKIETETHHENSCLCRIATSNADFRKEVEEGVRSGHPGVVIHNGKEMSAEEFLRRF